MERHSWRCKRSSVRARRLISVVALSTAVAWSWAAGAAYADTPPSNSTPPTITGVAQAGDQLTADPGTWAGDSPISLSYQWSDGQTGPTDTLSSADVGQSVSVTVTATNAFGQITATSDPDGPVLPAAPVVSTQPVITGIAQQGVTLSVSNGVWSADPNSNDPNGYTYAWEDCDSTGTVCSSIGGATSSSYTVQASDIGSTIVAVVTATNLGGSSPATSDLDGPVLPAAPVVSTQPVITGIAQQGVTLSVSNGVWSADPNSNDPNSYTYAWEDCDSTGTVCSSISGATSSSYTLQASDVGRYVSRDRDRV